MSSPEIPDVQFKGFNLTIQPTKNYAFGGMVLRIINDPPPELRRDGLPQEAEARLRPYLLRSQTEALVIPQIDVPVVQNVARQTVLFDPEITEVLRQESGDDLFAMVFPGQFQFNPRAVRVISQRQDRSDEANRLLQIADVANKILDATTPTQEAA